MRPNYLVDITQKIFALIFLICSSSLAIAQNVLIIYDDSPTNTNTLALKTSLQNQGFQVTISAASESFWNNTNPSLTGFHAVIHLNGSTYATEMPIAGQAALVNFVQNEGGVYVGFEWNAYQVSESEMLTMVDLIPIVRSSGQTQNITYTTVPAQASHPVLSGIPASFSLTNTGANIGSMRAYGTDPAVTLMMQASNAGLVYRAFGTGHVLMFSHAGNYVQSGASGAALSDTIVGQLIYNMIEEYADTKKRSLNFDGTNDFVQGSDAAFPSGNSARTMEAWIRTTKNGNGSIFEYGAVNVNQRSGLLCVNSHLYFVGQSNDLEGTITINDGTWHHVAMTHNGTTTNLYVDGVLDVTATKTLSTTPSHFRIGMRGNSISEQFDGNIDEVRLWGKAMSTAEIQAKANCELSGNECGLLAYYSFNNQNALSSENNAGQIVLGDSSGNGHDGALNNFALNGNSSNWVAQSDSISNSCSATLDTLAPIVFAIDTTIYLDASGNAAITVTQIDSASSDNCNIATRVLSDSTFDCTEVGINNITLTVTDVNGNVSVVSSVVTVIDSITPTTIAIDTTIYLSGAGTASVTVTQIGYLSSDNCATFNLALSDSVFDCTDADSTLAIILTGSDSYGNSSTDTSYITVLDTTAPVATAQNLTVYLDANGAASITPNDADNGSADNCPIDYLATSDSAFTCADASLTLNLELYAFDPSGNSDTAGFLVTVLDTTSPIVFAIDTTIYLDASGNAAITVTQIDSASSDNCNIATRVLSDSTFDCTEVGTNNITLTVTDVNGNVTTATSVVTVVDSITPTTIAIDTTIYLSGAGTASVTATQIGYLSSDNCATFNLALSDSVFDCTDADSTLAIILTGSDSYGNSSTDTSYITVLDTTAPVATAQNLTVYLDANGAASITPNDADNGSADNCPIDYLATSDSAFTCADAGLTLNLELYAFDPSGNSDTAGFSVTVLDTTSPIVFAIDTTIYLDASGNAAITVTQIDSASSDNCNIASRVLSDSTFDCTEVGTNNITLTVTDVNGNVSVVSSVVTVIDSITPTTIAIDTTIYLSGAGTASVTATQIGYLSSDNCATFNLALSDSVFDCTDADSTLAIILTGSDSYGNSSTDTSYITVLDTTAPVATAQNLTVYLDANGAASITPNDADNGSADNCPIDYLATSDSAFTCADAGLTLNLELYAFDPSGNSDTAGFSVTVLDTTSPIVFAIDTTIYLDASGNAAITVTQIDSASSDNCNIASRVLSDSTFDCTEVGTNNITLTVTDVNGNVSVVSSVVTVIDSITPTTIAIDTTIYLSGAGTASVTATQIGYLSSDNCATFNLALSDSVFDCTDAGTTQTIVLTVTDPSGNTDTALAYITIVDLSAPVLITQNLTIYLDSLGAATITADSVNNGTYDSCGIASLSISTSSFTCADTGANTIDFIAADVNGNADTVQVIITVLDTQPAVVIAQNLTLQLDASGQATTTALAVDNGSFDNCGIALVSISQSTFSCADTAAPQIITLYVEDVSGNIDSTTVLMTIEDNVAPTVVTTNFTVGLDSFGFASILADSIDDGSSDNCSIESIWLDQNTFSCANVNNPVTITLFVRDVSGNINFGTAVVTVIDTIAPQIVVQNDTAYLDSMGTVSIAATLLNNGTWDSCGVNYLTLSQGAFDCSDFGTQTIIFSATDFNGNTSTANVDITILDMIAPTIIIQDLIVYLDSFGVASITADSVDIGTWDSCGMASIIIDSSSFNCANHNDTLPVIFTATDIHGNVSFDTATFYIYDTLAPFIFAHSDTFYLDSAGQYVVSYTQLNDSTSDNCGVDSMYLSDTLFTCLTVDSIVNIWFYAHDIHGNLDSLELDITMLDTIRPQFLCPDGIIVSNDFDQCGAIVSFTFPTASDNCTVDSIIQIDPTGLDSGSFFPVGFTELTYVAYDQSMNTDTCSFIIEVQDTAAPVLFCVPDTAICDTIFTFDLPSYTDNCSGFDVIQIGGIETGLFYPVGVTVNEFAVTDSYGNSDTCSFEVLRYDFPTAANAGLDQEKCEVYTATLDGNDPLVGIGIWTRIAGVGTIDDTLDNQAIISDIDTGLTALEWRIENSVCPVERDTMTIIEYVNPTAANAGLDTSICDTNEVFLTAVETDFGYGRWILPTNGATIEDTTDFQSLVTDLELGSYQFTWRIVNGVCPVTTDVVTIDVVPYPVVDAGDIKYIFLPSSIELEATSDLEVVFDWTPKSSLINDETVITTATPAVTTTYMVAGTTEFGCTSTDFVDVVVNESLDLPTAFTPDGDNFNDVWNLKELSSYPDNVVKIYNRWGNLIFESTGYQESWEGTFNGEPLPSGSYFYIIDLNVGELKPFTGSITIIK